MYRLNVRLCVPCSQIWHKIVLISILLHRAPLETTLRALKNLQCRAQNLCVWDVLHYHMRCVLLVVVSVRFSRPLTVDENMQNVKTCVWYACWLTIPQMLRGSTLRPLSNKHTIMLCSLLLRITMTLNLLLTIIFCHFYRTIKFMGKQ